MMNDLVQAIIEGHADRQLDWLMTQPIDKCDFCGDYKRIVATNNYGIPNMCHDCVILFYDADHYNPQKLHKLRIEYQRRLIQRKL